MRTIKGEVWKDVSGYEGKYMVSSMGRFYSVSYKKVCKPTLDNAGYLRVGLWEHRKCKRVSLHRLVASTFIPNPKNLPEVNHKDENKTNNKIDNLEWCTRLHNQNYGTKVLRAALKNRKPVKQIDAKGNVVRVYSGICEAAKSLGLNQGTGISQCCNGKTKTAYGWRWEYVS